MQKTIKKEITFTGGTVHTGTNSTLILHPADVNTGIVFLSDGVTFPARIENVIDVQRGVTLGNGHQKVRTCEHLLSALYGLGIDNCVCELKGEEVPGLDGSTREFVRLITAVGIVEQNGEKVYNEIKEPILVTQPGKFIMGIPADKFMISFFIDYGHQWLKPQYASFTITPEIYEKELASARTYTFVEWIDKLRENNLIKGGNLDNAIVVTKDGPLNSLRFEDEFVRHKILDLIGDICLLGSSIKGHIIAIKSGHSLNHEFVKKLQEEGKNGI